MVPHHPAYRNATGGLPHCLNRRVICKSRATTQAGCAMIGRLCQFCRLTHRPALRGPTVFVRSCPISCSANSERNSVKNIFVGNLSFGATEAGIRTMFESYGAVDRVNIVTDRDSGQSRGFAFVEMSVDAEGNRAISDLNGRELDGRNLNINEARPKTERGSGGGGGQRTNRW
jgi:cold-inducible RNA-binding protein